MMNRIVKATLLASLCLGLTTLTSCCGSRCQSPCQAPCQAPCQQAPCQPVPYQGPCPAPYAPCAMPEPYMMQPVPMMFPCEPSPFECASPFQESYPSQGEITFAEQCECTEAPVTHEHNQNPMSQEMCELSICGHCTVLPAQEQAFETDSQTAQVENPELNSSQQ